MVIQLWYPALVKSLFHLFESLTNPKIYASKSKITSLKDTSASVGGPVRMPTLPRLPAVSLLHLNSSFLSPGNRDVAGHRGSAEKSCEHRGFPSPACSCLDKNCTISGLSHKKSRTFLSFPERHFVLLMERKGSKKQAEGSSPVLWGPSLVSY